MKEQPPEYGSMRIWLKTIKKLRMIAALTGETIVVILERLARIELERVKREQPEED